MADRDAAAKLRIYRTIYRLNLSFANIVTHCHALRKSGTLNRKYAHLYQSFAQELQAEINDELMSILGDVESEDFARYGKVRQAYEKELRDPDDVFIHAEERRKELARQHKKRRPATGGKAMHAQSGTGSRATRRPAPRPISS
jgi:hypothetical protein